MQKKTSRILIIDDDPLFSQTVQQQLEALCFAVTAASDGVVGSRLALSEEFALVLLDLYLPDTNGLTMLREWQDLNVSIAVVMISGQGTIPEAVSALKSGALDFLVKPVDINLLEAVVNRALSSQKLLTENKHLKELTRANEVKFIGISKAVKGLLTMADKIAMSDHPVLLEGETGTGKQLLAQYIYLHSSRLNEPFVRINCAALTQTLFESELFGHEKGAFTGAHARKIGKLELVGKGTLFLDEIGELPPASQAKLLTAVEDRTYERVGGNTTLYFEGRIIAATNRNLIKEVSEGRFRKDLFYRLNTFRLQLPPLRERIDDIPIYIAHSLEKCSREYGRFFEQPDESVLEQLGRYPWPGNVRELVHHIERIALFSNTADIPQQLWLSMPTTHEAALGKGKIDLHAALDEFKREHVMKVLSSCAGNQTEAAKRLGIGRTYLNRLLASYRKDK